MHDESRRVHGWERASHVHLTVAAKDLAHQVRRGRGPLVAGEKRGRVGIGRHVGDEEPNGLAGVPTRRDTVDERLDDGRIDTQWVVGSSLDPAERSETTEELGEQRRLPREVCVGDESRHEDQVEVAFADDLIRDGELAALRVMNLGYVHPASYRPFHSGARFSAKAATPSAVS